MHPTYEALVEEMVITEQVGTGQMMGNPGMKANGYFFAYFLKGEGTMMFKLRGKSHAEAMALAGAKLFAPGGNPMREWVVVPVEFADQWRDFAMDALEYIRDLPPKAAKRKKK